MTSPGRTRTATAAWWACTAVLLASCSAAAGAPVAVSNPPAAPAATTAPSPTAAPSPSTSPTPSTPAAVSPSPQPAASTPTSQLDARVFATVGDLELWLPSSRVELIGFHQSNHDGALAMQPHGALGLLLEDRDRDTARRGAADVVLPADAEVFAPVTGTVLRAGTYTLYCDHRDDYVAVEPDGMAGIEVKLLHIDGVQVRAGDRVIRGVTLLAPRPTVLPFDSQVNEHTAEPDTPHVHIEVVDTSIPDRPSEGGGC